MKVAIIGSRGVQFNDFAQLLPEGTTEILSGGAKGIDTCAKDFALSNGIPITEFLPDYARYGRGATHVRNRAMVDAADHVIAIWDGVSRGTAGTAEYAKKKGKSITVYKFENNQLTNLP